MKKNLVNRLEKAGDFANNLATNGLLIAGTLEGINYLDKIDYSSASQALVAGGAALGIKYLNDKGIVRGFSKGINDFARGLNGKAMPVTRNIALVAYLGMAGWGVGTNVSEVYKDFSRQNQEREEVVILEDTNKQDETRSIVMDRTTMEGRYLRTLRFKEILEKEEKEHNIEAGILAGLSMWEGYGNPLQLNRLGDGGAGMIQMQPGIARHYGLKTYGNSKALGRDKNHGKELKELLESINYSYEEAIKYDDRFSAPKNIDASARFLEDLYGYYKNWDKAISAYNVGQKKVVPVNTTHVKKVRECQKYYNSKN